MNKILKKIYILAITNKLNIKTQGGIIYTLYVHNIVNKDLL